MDLSNKRVVVTGASSGIGLAVVKLLLSSNCIVVAAAKETGELDLDHKRLFFYLGDLSSQHGIDQLFDFAQDAMGGIDIFIANAGFAYYEKISRPDWLHIVNIFNINTFGAIYSAEKMKQLHGEHPFNVVCTASAMAILPLPGYALYSATKAAIKGFADAYRYELNQGQHLQIIYPIATRTAFFRNAGDSPVPWPSQTAETVAIALVKGIRKNQKNIYPSRTFEMMDRLNRIFPFILPIYANQENKKFQIWLDKQHKKEDV